MSGPQKTKSDSHNFGRSVSVDTEGNVLKPRNIEGEWLILNPQTPWRKVLSRILPSHLDLNKILPSVVFDHPTTGPTLQPQKVSHVQLAALSRKLSVDDCSRLGALLTVFQWIGLVDLHAENLSAGLDENNDFRVMPFDGEMLFYDFAGFKRENALYPFPKGHHSSELFGLKFLQIYFSQGHIQKEDFLTIAEAMAETASLLVENSRELSQALNASLCLQQLPVRIVMRESELYARHLRNQENLTNLIPEEEEQLQRDDTPYFFQLPFQNLVFYWNTSTSWKEVSSPNEIKQLNLRTESDQTQFLREINFGIISCAHILAEVIPEDFDLKGNRLHLFRVRNLLFLETGSSALQLSLT